MPELVTADTELSHAEFDRLMVQTLRPRSPWVIAKPGPECAKPFDLTMMVRRKLATALASDPQLRGHRLDESNDALTYIASELLHSSLDTVHLRDRPLDEMTIAVRADLLTRARVGWLATVYADSPLHGKGRRQESEDGGSEHWFIDIQHNRYAKALLEYVAGGTRSESVGRAALRVLIERHLPELATLDETHLEIRQREWRGRIWKIIEGKTGLVRGDDEKILAETVEFIPAATDDCLEPIAAELGMHDWSVSRRQEISLLSDDKLDKRLLHYGWRRQRKRHQKERILLEYEASDHSIPVPPAQLSFFSDDAKLEALMRRTFDAILEAPESDEVNDVLRFRFPLLLFHITQTLIRLHEARAMNQAEKTEAALTLLQSLSARASLVARRLQLTGREEPALEMLNVVIAALQPPTYAGDAMRMVKKML